MINQIKGCKMFKLIINYFKELFKSRNEIKLNPVENIPKDVDHYDFPWMQIAKKEIGTIEIPGSKDNPRIIEYDKYSNLDKSDQNDETPWCASFVTWCLEQAKCKSMKSARARDYLNYGNVLDKPKYGCLVIYDRGNGNGHVHFYDSEDKGFIYGIGGNQDNQVKIKGYKKENVLGYRWPIQ